MDYRKTASAITGNATNRALKKIAKKASSGGKMLKTATPRTSTASSGGKMMAKRVRHPGSATTNRTTPSRSATKKQYY